ncbi:MAG: polyamine aminopropyltransferase [Dehalococcoidales bacterium]|nr:polyamine aminopropyltransferase [Dehalococcoidales bacterium]
MSNEQEKWFQDRISLNFAQLHRYDEVLYSGRTKYQSVQILHSPNYGKTLVLDNKIQSSEADEFIYHEGLVHPPMLAHPKPEAVFVVGGGEGAILREVLKYRTVKKAVMVDIDEEVVALSKKYLPEHAAGAFEDPRTEVYHEDARAFLEKSTRKYDVIIIDLPDPLDEGPAYLLYTQEFYRMLLGKLTANGIISVQSGSAMLTELLNFTSVANTLRSAFASVCPYVVAVPGYGGPWGLTTASMKLSPAQLSKEEIDHRIAERGITGLRFYDGTTHQGIFSLPRYLREAMQAQTRVIKDNEPLFSFKIKKPK